MPVIEDQIARAGGIIKAVAALFALLPFVAMLFGLVKIPPDIDQLIKGLTLAVSIVVILAIMTIAPRLARLNPLRVGTALLVMAIVGSMLTTGYALFADSHIIVANGYHVVPLHPSAEIRTIMAPYGTAYDEALQTSSSAQRLSDLMKSESASAVVLMVLLLVSAEVLLVAAVVGGAWYLAAKNGVKAARSSAKTPGTSPSPPA